MRRSDRRLQQLRQHPRMGMNHATRLDRMERSSLFRQPGDILPSRRLTRFHDWIKQHRPDWWVDLRTHVYAACDAGGEGTPEWERYGRRLEELYAYYLSETGGPA